MLRQTQRTQLTPRRHTTQSQILDAAETRGQTTVFTGKVSWKHHHGTFKKKMKLGPQHYPIHQWKWAGKEKKGEKKKEMLGNTSKWSVRNFVLALSLPCWSVVRWGPSEEVQRSGALTTTAHSDICSAPHHSGWGQDAATLCSHGRYQTSQVS